MTVYERFIKVAREGGWWSDTTMGEMIDYQRRNVTHMRERALRNGVGFNVKMDKLPSNSYVYMYKYNPDVAGYVSVDEKMEPLPLDDFAEVRYSLACESTIELLYALYDLNQTGYWTIDELAERLYCDRKRAKYRLYALMSSHSNKLHVHGRLGDGKKREYIVTYPVPKLSRRAKVTMTNNSSLINKVFGL